MRMPTIIKLHYTVPNVSDSINSHQIKSRGLKYLQKLKVLIKNLLGDVGRFQKAVLGSLELSERILGNMWRIRSSQKLYA